MKRHAATAVATSPEKEALLPNRPEGLPLCGPALEFTPGSFLRPPPAERATAPRRAGKIIRPRLAGRSHAEARVITDPFADPKVNGALVRAVEVVIFHVHGVRSLVDPHQHMEDRLASKRDLDLIFPGRPEPGREHHPR